MKAVSFFLCNIVSNNIYLKTVTAQGIVLDNSTDCLLFLHWKKFCLSQFIKITVFINLKKV